MPKGNATRLSDAKLIKKYFIFSDNENGSSIRVIKINTAIIKAKIMKMTADKGELITFQTDDGRRMRLSG